MPKGPQRRCRAAMNPKSVEPPHVIPAHAGAGDDRRSIPLLLFLGEAPATATRATSELVMNVPYQRYAVNIITILVIRETQASGALSGSKSGSV